MCSISSQTGRDGLTKHHNACRRAQKEQCLGAAWRRSLLHSTTNSLQCPENTHTHAITIGSSCSRAQILHAPESPVTPPGAGAQSPLNRAVHMPALGGHLCAPAPLTNGAPSHPKRHPSTSKGQHFRGRPEPYTAAQPTCTEQVSSLSPSQLQTNCGV